MLLEEFENVPAVIEPTDRSLISGGEICDTIILDLNLQLLWLLLELQWLWVS